MLLCMRTYFEVLLVLLEGCVSIGYLFDTINASLCSSRWVHQNTRHTASVFSGWWHLNGWFVLFVAFLYIYHYQKMSYMYICWYNKYLKNLVRDIYQAEVNLSRNVAVDAACAFDRLDSYVTAEYGCHSCMYFHAVRRVYTWSCDTGRI